MPSRLLACLVALLAVAAQATGAGPVEQSALDDLARRIVSEHHVPAIGLLVADATGETIAVAGVREINGNAPVEVGDAWHLGSCTKAVTALLAARLVDAGTITWDTTPADVLPDLPAMAKPANVHATLRQLLSHTSGLPGRGSDVVVGLIANLRDNGDAPAARQRRKVADAVLCLDPAAEPGEAWAYCNGGYILAGVMLETAAGTPLDALFQREIFDPLGVTTAGWGPPPDLRGHFRGEPSVADNPVAYDPAGRLHVSLADWAKLCRALLGTPDGFLSEAARSALVNPAPHTDPPYALGWIVKDIPGLGPAVTHDGTNGMWRAEATLIPSRDLVILVATNAFDAQAAEEARSAIADLLAAE